MGTFKDSEGREWSPRITCLVIDRFEEMTGIGILREASSAMRNVSEIVSIKEDGAADASGGEKVLAFLSALLGGKAGNLVKFAWCSVRRQADERKVSYEDFADALDGDALAGAAPVLLDEFSRFFRSAAGRLQTAATAKKEGG